MDGARLANAAVARGCTLAEAERGRRQRVVLLLEGPGRAGRLDPRRLARRRSRAGAGCASCSAAACARPACSRPPGLYALEHHVERLADDHARARALATALADCPRVSVDLDAVETNIVLARLRRDEPAQGVVDELTAAGVLCGAYDRRTVRFVTHLDIDDEALEAARDATTRVLI